MGGPYKQWLAILVTHAQEVAQEMDILSITVAVYAMRTINLQN